MKHPFYVAFGMMLLLGVLAIELRGWTPARASEVKDVPRSVRDNPGSYRPHYTYIGSSYRRGK
jgi:hypothetical protein